MYRKTSKAPPPPSQINPRTLPRPLKYLPPTAPCSCKSQIGKDIQVHVPKSVIRNAYLFPKNNPAPPPVTGGPPNYAQTMSKGPVIPPKALGAPDDKYVPLTWNEADHDWLMKHQRQYQEEQDRIFKREEQKVVGSANSFDSQPVFASENTLPYRNASPEIKPESVRTRRR